MIIDYLLIIINKEKNLKSPFGLNYLDTYIEHEF